VGLLVFANVDITIVGFLNKTWSMSRSDQ